MTDLAGKEGMELVDDVVANQRSKELLALQSALATAIRQVHEGWKPILNPCGVAFIDAILMISSISL